MSFFLTTLAENRYQLIIAFTVLALVFTYVVNRSEYRRKWHERHGGEYRRVRGDGTPQ